MYYSEYVDRYLSLTCESRRKFNGYIKKISTEALCLYIKCANQSFLGGRPMSPTPPPKKNSMSAGARITTIWPAHIYAYTNPVLLKIVFQRTSYLRQFSIKKKDLSPKTNYI